MAGGMIEISDSAGSGRAEAVGEGSSHTGIGASTSGRARLRP